MKKNILSDGKTLFYFPYFHGEKSFLAKIFQVGCDFFFFCQLVNFFHHFFNCCTFKSTPPPFLAFPSFAALFFANNFLQIASHTGQDEEAKC